MKRRHFLRRAGQGIAGAFGAFAGISPRNLWAVDGPPDPGAVTLFLAGDVMLGRGIDHVLPNPAGSWTGEDPDHTGDKYVALAEKANGAVPRPVSFDYVWGDALQELDAMAPAARLINLETSVTSSEDAWPGKVVHYRMSPANTPVLNAARIDGCSLANNHVLDFGYKGLTQTLGSLRQANVRCAGAGENAADAGAPAVFETGNGRVLMYFPTLDRNSGELRRFEIIPMRVARLRLQRASREESEWLAETLDRESRGGGSFVLNAQGRIELAG